MAIVSGNPVAQVVEYVKLTERLSAILELQVLVTQKLRDLGHTDPELVPELAAAAEGSAHLAEALVRAHQFIDARLDVRLGVEDDDTQPGGAT